MQATEPKNILIVEDNHEAAQTFKELLDIFGHEVKYLTSGNQAYDLLHQETFQIVFVDINLREMSGIELLKLIRASQSGNITHTRFVAVSGHAASDPEGIEAIRHFDYYLEKPIDLVLLDNILNSQ